MGVAVGSTDLGVVSSVYAVMSWDLAASSVMDANPTEPSHSHFLCETSRTYAMSSDLSLLALAMNRQVLGTGTGP